MLKQLSDSVSCVKAPSPPKRDIMENKFGPREASAVNDVEDAEVDEVAESFIVAASKLCNKCIS